MLLRIGALALQILKNNNRGKIVSISPNSATILLNTNELITLLSHTTPLNPWAATLSFSPSCLIQGTPVITQNHQLTIGNYHFSLASIIGEKLTITETPKLSANALHYLVSKLSCQNPMPDGPFQEAIKHGLKRFILGDTDGLIKIIGLGTGLTPSGDDCLVGVLAALELMSTVDPKIFKYRKNLVIKLPKNLNQLTSRLSVQMITTAVQGSYAEPVIHFLHTLARLESRKNHFHSHTEDITQALKNLLNMGSTSGWDTFQGIRAAIALCDSKP